MEKIKRYYESSVEQFKYQQLLSCINRSLIVLFEKGERDVFDKSLVVLEKREQKEDVSRIDTHSLLKKIQDAKDRYFFPIDSPIDDRSFPPYSFDSDLRRPFIFLELSIAELSKAKYKKRLHLLPWYLYHFWLKGLNDRSNLQVAFICWTEDMQT
ncbi:MAG: hypothetical protein M1353_02430 [Nitrospirae bacterium]|nr:hypothetical protein [Nitrospirota bacterium]